MSTAKKGRKPGAPLELVGPQMDQSIPQDDFAKQALVNSTLAGYADERDHFNQLVGEVRMSRAYEEFSRTLRISKLASIKASKAYRCLEGRLIGDGPERMAGTWEEFCNHILRVSVDKADLDIKNYKAFGEEALEAMTGAGIGYHQLAQLRRVPDDERSALVEIAKAGNTEQLRDLAEQLITKHLREKQQLEADLAEARETIATKDERAEKREKEIERLEGRVRKITREGKDAPVDQVAEQLRAKCSGVALRLRSLITARDDSGKEPLDTLRDRFVELLEHGAAHGMDHREFLGGLIGEALMELRRLRDDSALMLPIINDGDQV